MENPPPKSKNRRKGHRARHFNGGLVKWLTHHPFKVKALGSTPAPTTNYIAGAKKCTRGEVVKRGGPQPL